MFSITNKGKSNKSSTGIKKSTISTAIVISFILVLMILVPFIVQSPQVSDAFAPGAHPVHRTTTQGSSNNALSFPNSGSAVSSSGVEEPYVIQQVAFASNPNQVFQIVGAQIAQKVITGDNKNYFYLFINTGKSFTVNSSGTVATAQVSGLSTNNIYWNIQSPPGSNGGSMNFGTIGQDLDTGATSNTLSEWQWSDMNYVFGGKVSPISYTGSYDGGGPTACNTNSLGQERHSVYVMIADASTKQVYTITGGMLVQQNNNGLQSTTFITLIGGTQGKLSTGSDNKDCPMVSNPSVTPSLRWYVRTPPTSGTSPTGNFGITGSLGLQLNVASGTNALVLLQFVNRGFQTGFIPNQGCSTCVSMIESTNPVNGQQAPWPGVGGNGGGSSTTHSSTTSSTTTTVSSTNTTISSNSSSTNSSSSSTSQTSTHTTRTTTSQSSSTTTVGDGSYNVQLSITPLQQNNNGKYYNVQTMTFTDPNGNPVQGAQVTYYENCGCSGGYYHGTSNANGQTSMNDVYPGSGSYTEWASVTYQGQTYLSQKITVQVP